MYEKSENKSDEKLTMVEADKFSSIFFEWCESMVQAIIVVVMFMTFLFRFCSVDGTSMTNTLQHGDKIAVLKWKYVPENGDVVVIKHGEELNKPLVKRIIATQGQTVDLNFEEGSVTVDGVTLDEPYIKERMWLAGDAGRHIVIPQGYAFVMGDNRNNSLDSRNKAIGLIPYENILGKATVVIFPPNRMKIIK